MGGRVRRAEVDLVVGARVRVRVRVKVRVRVRIRVRVKACGVPKSISW